MSRFRQNLQYFRINYLIVLLSTIVVCMIMSPQSLIVLLALFGAWIYMFIIRTAPLTVGGRTLGCVPSPPISLHLTHLQGTR